MIWKKNKPHPITSVLSDDAQVHGNVQFKGGLQVNGLIKGNVTAESDAHQRAHLSLHRKGKVIGNISAPFLVLDGEVDGNVVCQKFLVVEKNCRITGDVHYQSMNIVPGAVITGRIRHVPEGLMLEHSNQPVGNESSREQPKAEAKKS